MVYLRRRLEHFIEYLTCLMLIDRLLCCERLQIQRRSREKFSVLRFIGKNLHGRWRINLQTEYISFSWLKPSVSLILKLKPSGDLISDLREIICPASHDPGLRSNLK